MKRGTPTKEKFTMVRGNGKSSSTKPNTQTKKHSPTYQGIYDPEKTPKAAYRLGLLGATNNEIAEVFGISHSTVDVWIKTHPEFAAALKRGKKEADANVAHAMYRRAIGYSHKDIDIKIYKGEVIKTEIIKHYPPDTVAAIFWLKNRTRTSSAPWIDVNKVEHSGQVNLTKPVDLQEFSDEELRMIRDCGLKLANQSVNEN